MTSDGGRGLRLFALVCCLMFTAFGALQWNDPDPWLWMTLYGYAAFLCWMVYKGRILKTPIWIGMAVCLLYGAYLFFDTDGVASWFVEHDAENLVQTMKAEKPWIEKTREFGGLAIVFSVLAFLSSRMKNSG